MCQHYGTVLSEEHRHYIDSLPHDNCVLCLVEDVGPMTQDEIAGYFHVTKERINQLEKAALRKIQAAMPISADDCAREPDIAKCLRGSYQLFLKPYLCPTGGD